MTAIGVFGGTFDPVHYGHLRSALEVRQRFGLQDFRLLPAGSPVLRASPLAAAEHRLAMLEMAASTESAFVVDDREIWREGKSYMVDTLAEIRQQEGDVPLLLIIGQDAANALDQWHQWQRLFELCHLVVMRRPDSSINYSIALHDEMSNRSTEQASQILSSAAGKVMPLEITQLDISATAIRKMLASGLSPRFLLPDDVIDYIGLHGLYRA